MQLIIIYGPSGSGKTKLSKIILKNLNNGIILSTDNYYKTGLISQIISKTVPSYFDRSISFNNKLLKRDLDFIIKNRLSNFYYEYNFKRKSVKKIAKKTKEIRFVIVEGIFGKEIIKCYSGNNCILVNLKTNKKSCMKRVIKRDEEERGKNKLLAKRNFIKSWELFYKNKNNSKYYFNEIILEKKSDIKSLLKKLTNIVN